MDAYPRPLVSSRLHMISIYQSQLLTFSHFAYLSPNLSLSLSIYIYIYICIYNEYIYIYIYIYISFFIYLIAWTLIRDHRFQVVFI